MAVNAHRSKLLWPTTLSRARDAQFHAWQNNFATYVNGGLADMGLAAGVMGAEIWVKVGDPPPTPPPPCWRPRKRKVERNSGQEWVAVPPSLFHTVPCTCAAILRKSSPT